MNSFVHMLEAVTLLLFCGLVYQIYRCNHNFYKAQDNAKVPSAKRSISIQVNIPSHLPKSSSSLLSNNLPVDYLENDELIIVDESDHSLESQKKSEASSIGSLEAMTNEGFSENVTEANGLSDGDGQDFSNESQNDRRLNEYIGEFFGGDDLSFSAKRAPDINSYKVDQDASIDQVEQNVGHEDDASLVQSSIEELSETMTQLSAVESSTYGDDAQDIPVLTASSTDSDDIITVEQEPINTAFVEAAINGSGLTNLDAKSAVSLAELPVLTELSSDNDDESIIVVNGNDASNKSDKIMSDKVVHAMLDEAKVVCAS